ncbi:MAG TPA: NAD(P)H-hydrate dehydratase [Bacteroidales bacterium]|nr:NAD(P)H-hydrate dehydratase [Bacteroidales bacterium]
MKIFTSGQIREIDDYTIKHEHVASVDLMERASVKILEWYIGRFEISVPLFIFVGPGNNGGDGLALARLLSGSDFRPEVYSVEIQTHKSADWELNRKRLESETSVVLKTISAIEQFPDLSSGSVIIDAIFGSGLSRPADGLAADVIRKINLSGNKVISIDIPSGLSGEDNSDKIPENIIHAAYTLSFQFPKLSFMFAENEQFVGQWSLLPIGLASDAIEVTATPWRFTGQDDVFPLLRKRNKFDHKGTFGHGLFIGGSYGKIGASILASKAALHTGIGLLTCHIPSCGNLILQRELPEAMISYDKGEKHICGPIDADPCTAAGIGPGMGTAEETQSAFHSFIKAFGKPLVIDADGLNILSLNKPWLSCIRSGTVMTPHPKEFERLVGKSGNSYTRLLRQIEFSAEHKCILVLKGAYTSISDPDGNVFFNSTGNPGMATAGSGDVLTGMILSLLAQGYAPSDAAVAGVYIHGLAGDLAAERSSVESVIASDIINDIGSAFRKIRSELKLQISSQTTNFII